MKEVFRYGRCIFARPNMDNVDDMVEMMNDPDIASMLSLEKRDYSREGEINWINKHQEDSTFSIYDANTLEYIGNWGYNEIENGRGEIGLVIRKQMQGKHYAKEIITGLVEYGYNELGLDDVYAIVFSDNVRSFTCVTELGFEEYNREQTGVYRNGKEIEDVYVSKRK